MMVHNPIKRYEYEKCRMLRNKGLSYNEIVKRLGVAKSSVSLWCRDIELSKTQKDALLKRKRTMMMLYNFGARANHEKRQKEIFIVRNSAKGEIEKLDYDALRVAGAMLYWAEGSKGKSTSISNSDPKIIDLMVRWFEKIFAIKPSQLTVHLHIHYGNDEARIKLYWSQLTGIPLKNFGKSFIKPKGTGHRTNILPNGIAKIRVKGIGTENLRHRILAWSEKIHELSKLTHP